MKPADWIALAAVLVTALGALFTWLTARKSIATQERASTAAVTAAHDEAEAERLWQRRADIYVDLLTWCHKASFPAFGDREYEEDLLYLPDDLQARARAFASPYVVNQLERVVNFHSRRMMEVQIPSQQAAKPADRAEKAMKDLRKMLDDIHELSLSIREDLNSDRAPSNRQVAPAAASPAGKTDAAPPTNPQPPSPA